MRYYVQQATSESIAEIEDEIKNILLQPTGVLIFSLSFFIGTLNSYFSGFILISFLVSITVFSRNYLVSPFDSFQPSYLGTSKAFLLAILFCANLLHLSSIVPIEPIEPIDDIINTHYEHDDIKDNNERMDFISENPFYSNDEKTFFLKREELKTKKEIKEILENKKPFFENSILKMFFSTIFFTLFLFVFLLFGYFLHIVIFSLYLFRNQNIQNSVALSNLFVFCRKKTTNDIKLKILRQSLILLFCVSFLILASDFLLLPLFFIAVTIIILYISLFYQKHIHLTDYDEVEIFKA